MALEGSQTGTALDVPQSDGVVRASRHHQPDRKGDDKEIRSQQGVCGGSIDLSWYWRQAMPLLWPFKVRTNSHELVDHTWRR